MILRQLLSIAILPVTVTVVIPIWLARRHGMRFAIGTATPEILLQLIGAASLAAGLLLFGSSLRQFAVRGKGTLAPWDPPKHLVVEGPYQYVRNPMISGVLEKTIARRNPSRCKIRSNRSTRLTPHNSVNASGASATKIGRTFSIARRD